jgi:hypothetical protein
MEEGPNKKVDRIRIINAAHLISQSYVQEHLRENATAGLINRLRQYGHEAQLWTGDPFWTDREVVTHCAAAFNSLGTVNALTKELEDPSLSDGARHWLGETRRIAQKKDY